MELALVAFGLIVLVGIGLRATRVSNQKEKEFEKRVMALPPAKREKFLRMFEHDD
jgi:hypothetical protein